MLNRMIFDYKVLNKVLIVRNSCCISIKIWIRDYEGFVWIVHSNAHLIMHLCINGQIQNDYMISVFNVSFIV